MRVLVFGAGVLGCNLARDFCKANKDVTLLARGDWAEEIKQNGLRIKNQISHITSRSRIKVITELQENDVYDLILVCMQYIQLKSILGTLSKNQSKNIVFIGNNVTPEDYKAALPDKNVLFGFAISAGHREKTKVVSIDMRKMTIGNLKTDQSSEELVRVIFSDMKYKIVYETNIGDYLISHAAFVVPACFACYYTDGNLKKIKKDMNFIHKIIDANTECYEALEATGHELLPKGEEDYHSMEYQKSSLRFYKLMCGTFLGKICASDHAMNAVDEMNVLAQELKKCIEVSGTNAPNYNELMQYMKKYLPKI